MTKAAKKRRPAARDKDAPIQGGEFFRKARPLAQVMPELAEYAKEKRRGRPRMENPKVPVSLRLDPNILESFKATGPGWQGLMHRALETWSAAHLAGKGLVLPGRTAKPLRSMLGRQARKG